MIEACHITQSKYYMLPITLFLCIPRWRGLANATYFNEINYYKILPVMPLGGPEVRYKLENMWVQI